MAHTLIELIGFAAAAATAVTFYCRQMVWLRACAIAANVLFITYGAAVMLMPILLLHCFLLPLNILRLHDALRRRTAEGEAAADADGARPGAVYLAMVRGGPVVKG